MTHQNNYNLSSNLAEGLLAIGFEGILELMHYITNTAIPDVRKKQLKQVIKNARIYEKDMLTDKTG